MIQFSDNIKPADNIKPDWNQQVKGVLDAGIHHFQKPEYFGKFRAYLFMNFIVIGLLLLMASITFLGLGEKEAGFGCLMMTAADAVILFLLWLPVAKKAKPEERGLVFRGFFCTSVLVFGKVLLFCTIIFIPLALRIGGYNPFEYRTLSSGALAGQTILVRQKWNGQFEDRFGNIYEND